MVGKNTKSLIFHELMTQYKGKPYSVNGYGPDSYGCFGLVYAYLKDCGVKVPTSCWTIRGTWTIENYGSLIRQDLKYAESVMDAIYDVIGEPAPVSSPLAGDILICRNEVTKGTFPAIYVGNGNALAAILNDKVRVFGIDRHNTIVAVRRIKECRK
jgi:cell wall-associated NlpC family hydrolase